MSKNRNLTRIMKLFHSFPGFTMTSRTFLPRIKIAFLTFYNATGVSDSTLMHCSALQSFSELQRLPSMLSNSVHHKLLGWEIGTVNQLNTSDFISANTIWKCRLPETGSGLNRRRVLMARDKESLHLMARRQRTPRPQQLLSKMKPINPIPWSTQALYNLMTQIELTDYFWMRINISHTNQNKLIHSKLQSSTL